MPNLAPIIYNTETISARHAPSLNAAFRELYELTGIKPIVQSPDGGARTKQECLDLGLDWRLSDHYEDSPKGRAAVDIWNQRTFRNLIGDAAFEGILAKHGWRNIQINGQPFPSEPWHFANHDAIPSTPAGFAPNQREDDMNRILVVADAKNGRVVTGQRFYQGADQILYPLTKRQYEIDERCNPGAIWTEWTGDDVVAHAKNVGLWKYTPDLSVKGGVGKLTGPVIFDL